MPIESWLDLALLVLVVAAAINDLAVRKIPNKLLLAGCIAALGLYLCGPTPAADLRAALGGAVIGFGLFLPLYVLRGMAAGDVKMMAAVGFFLGPAETLHACILAWCIGGLMALVILLVTGRWRIAYTNIRNILLPLLLRMGPAAPGSDTARPSAGSMPYGLAIALSTIWLLAQRHHA